MVKITVQEKIHELKLAGMALDEIRQYLVDHHEKVPCDKTLKKYYDMKELPNDPAANLAKDKAFGVEPFHTAIITIMERNSSNSKLCLSSVYDVLEEKFVDDEQMPYTALPGNEQTLRNYIHYLEDSGQVTRDKKAGRIYDGVFETAPGEQMQIDFGETTCRDRFKVHYICLLLHYSRFLIVICQDHKFNSVEACRAIYTAFKRIGGRVLHLVIDQDSVFVQSEQYGEVVETTVFKDFLEEQELDLRVCRKADPETKGAIENCVKFVQTRFFSARKADISSMDDVWGPIAKWQKRANDRIHKGTYCVPSQVFEQYEKKALRPLLPSFYETTLDSYKFADLEGYPFITYSSNQYSVPKECCFGRVYYKPVKNRLYIYDSNHIYVCTHTISELKGKKFQLDEHKHQEPTQWYDTAERMREKWNCTEFQHFVNGVKKENSRGINNQLNNQFRAIEEEFEKLNPTREQATAAINYACKNFRYRYSQFKVVLKQAIEGTLPDRDKASELAAKKAAAEAEAVYNEPEVEKKSLGVYQLYFNNNAGISPVAPGGTMPEKQEDYVNA